MAKLIFGMNVSLDGYVDHEGAAPGPLLFRHYIEQVRGQTGSVYGRGLYEVMRYWDEDQPGWDAAEREFAAAWDCFEYARALCPNHPIVLGKVVHFDRELRARHPQLF